MPRILRLSLALSLLAIGAATPSFAVVITNGSLSVTIRDDNGAIDTVAFGGRDFYNPGTPLSDWALQTGMTTASFENNTTTGVEGIPVGSVTSAAGVVTATGSYGSVAVTREYWILPGLDVLRTRTTLVNTSLGPVDLRLVDTFDPDQGIDGGSSFNTTNDLYVLSGIDVARSTNGRTVIMGGFGSSALSFGCFPTTFGLGVTTGAELNALFASSPCDPGGASADIGIAIGFETLLASGASASFTFDQAYGLTVADAEAAFAAAVPEPGSLVLLGSGLAALFARNRRRAA